MINIDLGNMPIGSTPVFNKDGEIFGKFSMWREADLIHKELIKKYNDKFPNSFPTHNFVFGEQGADCVSLDERIKAISYDIEKLALTTPTKTGLDLTQSKNPDVIKLYVLREILLDDKKTFNRQLCTDVLEKKTHSCVVRSTTPWNCLPVPIGQFIA